MVHHRGSPLRRRANAVVVSDGAAWTRIKLPSSEPAMGGVDQLHERSSSMPGCVSSEPRMLNQSGLITASFMQDAADGSVGARLEACLEQ